MRAAGLKNFSGPAGRAWTFFGAGRALDFRRSARPSEAPLLAPEYFRNCFAPVAECAAPASNYLNPASLSRRRRAPRWTACSIISARDAREHRRPHARAIVDRLLEQAADAAAIRIASRRCCDRERAVGSGSAREWWPRRAAGDGRRTALDAPWRRWGRASRPGETRLRRKNHCLRRAVRPQHGILHGFVFECGRRIPRVRCRSRAADVRHAATESGRAARIPSVGCAIRRSAARTRRATGPPRWPRSSCHSAKGRLQETGVATLPTRARGDSGRGRARYRAAIAGQPTSRFSYCAPTSPTRCSRRRASLHNRRGSDPRYGSSGSSDPPVAALASHGQRRGRRPRLGSTRTMADLDDVCPRRSTRGITAPARGNEIPGAHTCVLRRARHRRLPHRGKPGRPKAPAAGTAEAIVDIPRREPPRANDLKILDDGVILKARRLRLHWRKDQGGARRRRAMTARIAAREMARNSHILRGPLDAPAIKALELLGYAVLATRSYVRARSCGGDGDTARPRHGWHVTVHDADTPSQGQSDHGAAHRGAQGCIVR